MIDRLRAFWNSFFRRDQLNHDLDEGLYAYVDLVSAEKVRLGMSPDEAYRDTRREMGGMDQVRQRVRDIRPGAFLERLAQDMRYATRSLAKNPALFGLAAGIPAALLLTRFLSTLLFAVRPTDPLTFLGVAVLLTLVALAAAFFPALRAMRVDAMTALRCE